MDQETKIKRTIQSLFHAPDWKRLRMFINNAEHDADKEAILKMIRLQLIADLASFRSQK